MTPAKKVVCQFCGEEPELKYQGNGSWAYAGCACRQSVISFVGRQFESKQQLVELAERIEKMGVKAALLYLHPAKDEDQFSILQFVKGRISEVPWR